MQPASATVSATDPIAALLVDQFGLTMTATAEQRIGERCLALRLDREGLLARLRADPLERQALAESIPDTASAWYADADLHHDLEQRFLRQMVKRQAKTHRPTLRAWVPACGTGGQAWSIAGALQHGIPDADCWEISVLATDIHSAALARAAVGRYAAADIPAERLPALAELAAGGQAVVNRRLRNLVAFAYLNLCEPWPTIGTFDLIVCTGVLPGMPADRAAVITAGFASLLRQGGTLRIDAGMPAPATAASVRLRETAPGIFARPLS